MNNTDDKSLKVDEQIGASLDRATEARLRTMQVNLHTMLPGIVVSFDAVQQSAVVQPAIRRIFTERGPVNLPVCVDVPVEFPGGGGYFLTFPVKPGDECVLCFSERAIDYWWISGGTQLPAEYRMHDLSDAIARVGLNSLPNKIPSFATNGAEFRDRDGSMRVILKDDGTITNITGGASTILSPGGTFTVNADLIVNGDITDTGTITSEGSITGAGINFNTHRHPENDSGGPTGGPIP
jgi:hypothetical protein